MTHSGWGNYESLSISFAGYLFSLYSDSLYSRGSYMRFVISLLLLFQVTLFSHEYVISLGDLGSIHYLYENKVILHVDRLSPSGELIYRHSYNYDNNRLISENLIGDLGEVVYELGIVKSPYHLEICEYDNNKNLIKHTQDTVVREYSYNNLNELISEESKESYEYNLAGNLIRKGNVYFIYDEENKLVKASSSDYEITYTYDSLGRRDSKTVNGETDYYGYYGSNEIAIFDSDGQVKELRIPGLSPHKDLLRPIAVETRNAIYAPIHDVQNNIVKLIDIKTKEVISLDLPDPFGRGLSKDAPTSWIFAGKHYEKEVGLVYFGHRYYALELKKWLSFDPARQSSDLHQYCFNNPLSYFDPDGQIVFVIPLIGFSIKAAVVATAYASAAAATAWGTYKVNKMIKEKQEQKRFKEWKEQQKEPPYNGEVLGNNPKKPPAKGFEWKGKGSPESGRGSWYNPETGEQLYPDFNHLLPIKPHWDYESPQYPKGVRLYLDGTWEPKS